MPQQGCGHHPSAARLAELREPPKRSCTWRLAGGHSRQLGVAVAALRGAVEHGCAPLGSAVDRPLGTMPSAPVSAGCATRRSSHACDGQDVQEPHSQAQHFAETVSMLHARHPTSRRRPLALLLSSTSSHKQNPRPSSASASTADSLLDLPSSLAKLAFTDRTPHLLSRTKGLFRGRHVLPLSGSEPVFDERDERWVDDLHGSYSYALQDHQEERDFSAVPGDLARGVMALNPHLSGEAATEQKTPVLDCRAFVKQVLADNQGSVLCSRPDEACPRGFYKVMSFVTEELGRAPPEVQAAGQAISFLDYHFYMQHKDVVMHLSAGDRLEDVSTFLKLPVEHLMESNPKFLGTDPTRQMKTSTDLFVPGANVWSHKPAEHSEPRIYDGEGNVIRDPRRATPSYSDDGADEENAAGVVQAELPDMYCCSFCVKVGHVKTGRMKFTEL
ncbi:MAG: hypothetical protein WDW38_009962 [Sanguina aurantia]